ncbi:MAG: DEAD/DEAH box helicase [Planctomycetota bacterium]
MTEPQTLDPAPQPEADAMTTPDADAPEQPDASPNGDPGEPALPEAFAALGLRDSVLKGVAAAGFTKPSDIQAALIPAALSGGDIIGQARTGTGKTAAFGLPLLHACTKDTPMQALILTPTRELAAQVAAEINALGKHTPIKATCIVGGESMRQQRKAVEDGAQIIVGTPGRVMDLHGRRQIHFNDIKFAILDEVDRMLDIGFRDEIRKILGHIKGDHQTIFVSATMDEDIERLARRFMKEDAQKLSTVEGSLTVEMVDQKYLTVERWDKRTLLLHLLKHEEPDTTVVFCKTKATVTKVTKYLKDKGVDAREIHGNLHQKKRNKVMQSMRDGNLSVLIASDLAARGLDVEHITHVINYDLPEDPEIYVHRIGRTARAGRRGIAWTFVTPDQGQMLTNVEKMSGALIELMEYPDFKPGPVPSDIREERAKADARANKPKAQPGPPSIETLEDEELKKMFPGGVVPKGAAKRTLGSRMRTRRGR